MTIVADYSNGRLTPSQLASGGFAGAIRYLRKRGPSGVVVLSVAEVRAFLQADMALGLVYEDGAAGWMLGGDPVGYDRGLWALRQARAVGIEPRCIYFADDDVRTAAQVPTVLACLAGARRALVNGGTIGGTFEPPAQFGGDVAGLYGFRAVIEATHARYRWLTGSKPTDQQVAALGVCVYQRNYGTRPTIDGVQCDVNDTYHPDWGQHFGAIEGDDVALTAEDVTGIVNAVWGHDVQTGDQEVRAYAALSSANQHAASVDSRVNALAVKLDQINNQLATLAQGPAASIDTGALGQAIAAELGPLVASAVADELDRRLQS